MVVVIVEDDANWRHELALMYSRMLSDSKEVTGYHPAIRTFATARETIEYFKPKPGERSNASPKVDVLSLDLNLGRHGGGTGFDVLTSAVNAGQKFVTIAVSGYGTDTDLHDQLGSKTSYLIELETRVASQTKAKCIVHEKKSEKLWSIDKQTKALEKRLRNEAHGNSNVLRDWTEDLRGTAADLNGKVLCLHFELPKELMGGRSGSWVTGALTSTTWDSLNKISAWHYIFEEIDHNSTQSDLLTRLLFLITPKKNYQTGISLRPIGELIDQTSGKFAAPLPKKDWICPRKGNCNYSLTPRESFQLTQLIFQKMLTNPNQESECKLSNAVYKDGEVDYENVAAPPSMPKFDLVVSGLLNGNTLTTPARKSLKNGASLEVERYVPKKSGGFKESAAVKTTRCELNKKLKDILGVNYDLITAVDAPSRTYKLQIKGCVYIQCET